MFFGEKIERERENNLLPLPVNILQQSQSYLCNKLVRFKFKIVDRNSVAYFQKLAILWYMAAQLLSKKS